MWDSALNQKMLDYMLYTCVSWKQENKYFD